MFASWSAVAAVIMASALLFEPSWLVIPLWPLLAAVSRWLGASGTYGKALRRLARPAAAVVIAGWLALPLPWLAGALAVTVSLPLAGWHARLARFRGGTALGLPLILLAATLIYSAWQR